MDEPVILEFSSAEGAQDFMAALDALALSHVGQKGYAVWDAVTQSPAGTYYITSPGGDARFTGWRNALSFSGGEKTLPQEWRQMSEE